MSRILDKTQIEDKIECAGNPARNQFFVLANQLRNFRKDERGSIIIFSLFIFIMMLMIGGIAVDVMRAEYQRTTIQYTSDRAVLAAASLNQTVPAQAVIDDYFAKAGIVGFTPVATMATDETNLRKVVVAYPEGQTPHINTMFMNMVGLDTLDTPAQASAVDGVEKVEISLVLDVSGSMGSHSRLVNLKVAAKEFIDTILLNPPSPDTYSISIVPYATQVSVGQNLLSKYNVTSEHDYSNCVDFQGSDFNSTAVSTTTQLQRTGHFAPWNSYYRVKPVNWKRRPCAPIAEREIVPVSGANVTLKNYIDGFTASGNTSTDIGIKWGAALLDPSARDVVTSLIADNAVESKFAGRPFDYTEEGVLKVIVVMTDGHNTNQYFLEPEFSTGMSNVWLMQDNVGDRYSIREDRDTNTTSDDRWAHTYRESTSRMHWSNNEAHSIYGTELTATQLTYPELWNHASMRYVATYLEQPANYNGEDYSYWRYGTYGYVGANTKDTRMNNICSAAKANNVLIFTIGFEVTDSNAAKLQNCATTAAHFFRVEGVEISEAFASIAAQLNSLRLVK